MIYLIEEGFYKEKSFKRLVKALEETNSVYKVVKVEDDSINCYLKDNEKYIIFGGNNFSRLAKQTGLYPGTYKNFNFDYSICVENWGSEMLNYDYIIGDIFDIEPLWDTFFIRPLLDDKIITGKITTKFELEKNRQSANISYKGKLLIASKVKEIFKEYRLFIVDSEIITGCVYKVDGKVYTYFEIPEEVRNYVEKVINIWEPSQAYVIDIADTEEGLKIIEINNLNASGFYDVNVEDIIRALNELNSEVYMDSLTKYIFDNYYMYMTLNEKMALRYFIFKNQEMDEAKNYKRRYFGAELSGLIKMSEDEFYNFVRDRIMNQYHEEIFLNYCPKCGNLTITPRSKQCLKCKHKWHKIME